MTDSVCIVIPARLGSTRLPEKALLDIHGKSMIQHVYERAKKVKNVEDVVIATDHEKIMQAVSRFGGKAVLTPESLQSGSDRVAWVANENSEKGRRYGMYVNVQGDEPLLDPICVERAVDLVKSGKFQMSTAAALLSDKASLESKNVVKVLVAKDKSAVYFSRYPIPFSRMEFPQKFTENDPQHHLGIYVYRTETLLKYSSSAKTTWEVAESLEQLRALYHGIRIGVARADAPTIGVDTMEDLEAVRKTLQKT